MKWIYKFVRVQGPEESSGPGGFMMLSRAVKLAVSSISKRAEEMTSCSQQMKMALHHRHHGDVGVRKHDSR